LVPAAVFLASVPLAYLASPAIARLAWLSLLVVDPAVGALTARACWLSDGG
jgi:TMEM175 potassium channel family protein